MKPVLMKDKSIQKYGVTLYRLYWPDKDREGGWAADTVVWPETGDAAIFGDAYIFGGEIWGGVIGAGVIRGGEIWGGEIWGGVIGAGVIRGGIHTQSPAMAQRSDGYCFIVHPVEGELRVWAGCRDFSWDEAVTHWGSPTHKRREESLRIIHFLKEQVEARSV